MLGFGSVSGFFFALGFLPVADATALSFLAPVFVALASPYLLGEQPVGIWPALAACLLGVLLIVQPSFIFGHSRLSGIGLVTGLLHPIMSAMAKVCISQLVRRSANP
jgi:drug/metabolite transporter (DMT)-like permease